MPRHPRPVPLRSLKVTSPVRTVPPTPVWLMAKSKEHWTEFWTSPLARVLDPVLDYNTVETLFRLRDERDRALRQGMKQRLVAGSAGQLVINPLLTHAATMQREVRALESTLGLNPKSRMGLAVLLGDASRSLEDINADLEADTDVADLLGGDALEG